jgi:hypothetical protein
MRTYPAVGTETARPLMTDSLRGPVWLRLIAAQVPFAPTPTIRSNEPPATAPGTETKAAVMLTAIKRRRADATERNSITSIRYTTARDSRVPMRRASPVPRCANDARARADHGLSWSAWRGRNRPRTARPTTVSAEQVLLSAGHSAAEVGLRAPLSLERGGRRLYRGGR